MPNYQNGKIYKLWSPEGDDIYIGATTQKLYARFYEHKTKNNCSSRLLFQKYNDVRIELIENFSCDNKEQLTKREGEYKRNTNCINKNVAGITNKEYCKEWYENNKDKIKEYRKEYRKEYYENNKEKIKEYYENNKEQKSQQYTCECGRTIQIQEKPRHERTLIHCNWVKLTGNGSSDPVMP